MIELRFFGVALHSLSKRQMHLIGECEGKLSRRD